MYMLKEEVEISRLRGQDSSKDRVQDLESWKVYEGWRGLGKTDGNEIGTKGNTVRTR